MSLKLLKPEEVASAQFARWGIYGANGVGKTTFLSTVPTAEMPMLVVSADDENVKPLRGLPNVAVAKVIHWNDLGEILSLLQKGLLGPGGQPKPEVLRGEAKFFRVLAFDTWTRMQALAANKLVGYELIRPGEEVNYLERAPKLPKGFEGWQQVGALASEWMRYFLRLPIHVIFLFQENTREAKFEGDPIVTAPALTPEALRSAREALELVGRLYVVDSREGGEVPIITPAELRAIDPGMREKRMLLIGKHERYFAKGPTHVLGYVIEEPSWAKLAPSITAPPISLGEQVA